MNPKFIKFLRNRYKNYEVIEYPEIETVTRQTGEDKYGWGIGETQLEHLYDNLGFVNKETKREEITLPNMGINAFQGFNTLREIVEFLDSKL